MELSKSAEEYYLKDNPRKRILLELRRILLECGLEEDCKWGAPAYLWKGKNIIGVAAFKNYAGLWFHQGVYLSDAAGVLINAQEGKTKALRQWRFETVEDLNEALIKSYVFEAIRNQEDGKVLKVQKRPLLVPDELQTILDRDTDIRTAFEALTPGKQKEYAEYIAEAKREATRLSRRNKAIPMILKGMGLNDKYR